MHLRDEGFASAGEKWKNWTLEEDWTYLVSTFPTRHHSDAKSSYKVDKMRKKANTQPVAGGGPDESGCGFWDSRCRSCSLWGMATSAFPPHCASMEACLHTHSWPRHTTPRRSALGGSVRCDRDD